MRTFAAGVSVAITVKNSKYGCLNKYIIFPAKSALQIWIMVGSPNQCAKETLSVIRLFTDSQNEHGILHPKNIHPR
jgi:hypothetical protein